MAEPDFWTWSLDRYRREGVESLALRLQDGFGLSVNLLLWSCWCAERYDATAELVMRKAVDVTAQWGGKVAAPLRAVRRYLNDRSDVADAAALRDDVKAAELEAERLEQAMLEDLARSALSPATAQDRAAILARARRNLATYAALSQAPRREGFSTSLLHDFIDRIFGAGVTADAE